MEEIFLYQELDVLKLADKLHELPECVVNSISQDKVLREYQKEAFRYFITYFENDKLNEKKQIHTLFYMATGSGKTLIMAGLIYYLYTKGYSNFLFFVNQTNILEKTKDNFLNIFSSKYLFNQYLEYAGKKIKINAVDNFNCTHNQDINICFTTTQKLHQDLFIPKENSLTFDDFENNKIVFISDESHHINAMTKKTFTKISEEENNWEYSVIKAFKSNKYSILLEFTATIDLEDKNVLQKYKDKIIYNYPLNKFRKDGFTKGFENFATGAPPWQRTLMAMVLSEYRRFLASDVKLNIKPVLMLKSKTIKDSEAFYKEFFEHVDHLQCKELLNLYESDVEILLKALSYFKDKDDSFILLKQAIQSSFQKEKAIIINGYSDDSKEKQLLLNSLEDKGNQVRIIFAVDMLNEGWDVLNLFDIVRLYDSKQTSEKTIDSYTIKEAQLIGRAARYFPFQIEDTQEKNKRKYDYDMENKFRVLETMYFHSSKNSGYILALKKALIKTGFESEKPISLTLSLKEEFKQSKFYNSAFVFSNKRRKKERKYIYEIEEKIKNKIYYYEVPTLKGEVLNLFGNVKHEKTETKVKTIQLKDIDYHILLGAIDFFSMLSFDVLKNIYPNLYSVREFLSSSSYLGNIKIEFKYKGKIKGKDVFEALKKVFSYLSDHIISIKTEYEGTTEFEMKYLKNILKDKTIYLTDISDNGGKGCSQNNCLNQEYKLNLLKENWYVFNDNYGTQEEKLFIKFFKSEIAPKLDEKHIEYYVIRNERIPELAIYNFEDGKRFEVDYLLFVKQKNMPTYQVYAEPKAEMLFAQDAWKENFMLNIKSKHKIHSSIATNYKILGLPFFNHIHKLDEFKKAFNKFIDEFIN